MINDDDRDPHEGVVVRVEGGPVPKILGIYVDGHDVSRWVNAAGEFIIDHGRVTGMKVELVAPRFDMVLKEMK